MPFTNVRGWSGLFTNVREWTRFVGGIEHTTPPSSANTPKAVKDRQLIIERPQQYKNEPFNKFLLCEEINKKIFAAGQEGKAGLVSTAHKSRSNNIVLQVDANHNANSMWAIRNTIAPAIRDVLGHPYELKRNLEGVHIRVLGVPLKHNNPHNPTWQPSDWNDDAFEALRLQFNKFNPPANALDRLRIVGNLMSLKARKEKSCVVVFGVETNRAAPDLLKGGYAEPAFSARKCVEHVADPSKAFCDTCLSPLHFTGLCRNRPRCKYCLGEHLSTKYRCVNTACRTERPVVGRPCMMHDSKRCLNCDGTDHLSGAKHCPARGTPREVDLDDEPNAHVNDPTTSGAHQHPRDPARRGAKALREKHKTPTIVIDSAPSSRPSTP